MVFKDFSLEEEEEYNGNEDEEPLNLYTLDETINDIIMFLPYSLEFYLNVVPDNEFEDKTEDSLPEDYEEGEPLDF